MLRCVTVAIGAVLLSLPVGCKSEEKPKAAATPVASAAPAAAAGPVTYEDSIKASVSAKVKAVDASTRVITLRDEAGHDETFVVDKSVTRLNEVKPGDTVTAEYRAKLLAELRPPTADEAAHP